MNEEQLKIAYYLKGWKLLVWRLFMKYVYEDLKKGHQIHLDLIKGAHIAHQSPVNCVICKQKKV